VGRLSRDRVSRRRRLFIQSRDLRPLDRYFPELHDALLARCRRLRGSTARS
jgi:hypothetical protein